MSLELLPPSARELAELIGLENALRVCELVGGLKPYIPAQMDEGHALFAQLAEAIGEAAAKQLFKQYGGDFLELPRCSAWARAARDAAILETTRPIDELARANGLTRRRIFQIRARSGDATRSAQTDLFQDGQ